MPPAADSQPPVEPPRRSALNRLFSAFAYRDFRLLWFGAFTSSSGTWMQQTAQGWLVFELTGSSFFLGLDSALGAIPFLLFSLVGGVVADRVDRRRILLTSQFLQLTFAFTLALLAALHLKSVWPILALSFLTGCAQAFGGPAYQALMPALVERRDVPNAIALNSMQFNLARVVGPVVGGVVLTAAGTSAEALNYSGAALCFTLNGVSFLAVIVSLLMLRVEHIPRTAARNMIGEMRGGLSFVWHQEALRSLTLISFSSTLFGIQFITFLPVFADRMMNKGAGGYSALLAVSGAGSVVGALWSAWLGEIKHKGRAVLLLQIVAGLTLTIFALLPVTWLAYPLVFVVSGCLIATFSLTASLVQLLVSDEIRGRVMSIYFVAFRGGMPLGNLLTGWLAEKISLATVIAGEGLALCLIAAAYLLSKSKVNEH